MKVTSKTKNRNKFIVKLFLFFILVCLIFIFTAQQIKIQNKKAKIEELSKQINIIQIENEKLYGILNEENQENKNQPRMRIFENILK